MELNSGRRLKRLKEFVDLAQSSTNVKLEPLGRGK